MYPLASVGLLLSMGTVNVERLNWLWMFWPLSILPAIGRIYVNLCPNH